MRTSLFDAFAPRKQDCVLAIVKQVLKFVPLGVTYDKAISFQWLDQRDYVPSRVFALDGRCSRMALNGIPSL